MIATTYVIVSFAGKVLGFPGISKAKPRYGKTTEGKGLYIKGLAHIIA
jgi:hypothetical protein